MLGEAEEQQFGSGRGLRQLIQRWDWKGHAFLLASQDGEYVNLKIMTTDAADNKGRGERLSDAKLRELTTGNLITRDNGDVLIDKGLPMIWTMFSSREYNEFVNERSRQRFQATDRNAWEERTKSESREVELRKDRMTAHACMIIGYNKETGEIAVSDSWGPSYQERWVPAEQAEQVSQGSLYLVEF